MSETAPVSACRPAQSPYEIEPIDAREHAVDDDDVIVLGSRLKQAVPAIREVVNGVTFLGQSLAGCKTPCPRRLR